MDRYSVWPDELHLNGAVRMRCGDISRVVSEQTPSTTNLNKIFLEDFAGLNDGRSIHFPFTEKI
jgi:hypothetical protein